MRDLAFVLMVAVLCSFALLARAADQDVIVSEPERLRTQVEQLKADRDAKEQQIADLTASVRKLYPLYQQALQDLEKAKTDRCPPPTW